MTCRNVWYNDDQSTPLPVLRDRLIECEDDRTGFVNALNVTILLCDRLQAAIERIDGLERDVAALLAQR